VSYIGGKIKDFLIVGAKNAVSYIEGVLYCGVLYWVVIYHKFGNGQPNFFECVLNWGVSYIGGVL
jgi:hypothetical protein